VEWRLRDLRARVKLARAVVSRTTGLADTLTTDWRKAARFYARFGITEKLFLHGIVAGDSGVVEVHPCQIRAPYDELAESRFRTFSLAVSQG
jgi:hypothetical protein